MNNPSGNSRIEKNKQRKFAHYKERLNVGLIISFNYPEELKIDRIENGICIHDKNIINESEIISQSNGAFGFTMHMKNQ